MAKVKVPRKDVSLDMTAMCDVAFLLLTFFMLTTKFKPDEPVVVDTPSSVSQIKLPDVDILTISVDKQGKVFFGVDGQFTREKVLKSMAEKHKIQFTPAEIREFSLTTTFGAPVANLKEVLNMSAAQRAKSQPGIPVDSLNNELKDWINFTRYANRKIRIAIKGDRTSDYDVMKKVITTLQEQNINKFNLITNMEERPKLASQ